MRLRLVVRADRVTVREPSGGATRKLRSSLAAGAIVYLVGGFLASTLIDTPGDAGFGYA